jgi:hypothetical protein
MKSGHSIEDYHYFEVERGSFTLLNDRCEVLIHGAKGLVDRYVVKLNPATTRLFYYKRDNTKKGFEFVCYAHFEPKKTNEENTGLDTLRLVKNL